MIVFNQLEQLSKEWSTKSLRGDVPLPLGIIELTLLRLMGGLLLLASLQTITINSNFTNTRELQNTTKFFVNRRITRLGA